MSNLTAGSLKLDTREIRFPRFSGSEQVIENTPTSIGVAISATDVVYLKGTNLSLSNGRLASGEITSIVAYRNGELLYEIVVDRGRTIFSYREPITYPLTYQEYNEKAVDAQTQTLYDAIFSYGFSSQATNPFGIVTHVVPTAIYKGSPQDDWIKAGGSEAEIYGHGGNDRLEGAGAIHGGDGDDTLVGFGIGDRLFGGAGNDSLRGGFARTDMDGGDGSDTYYVDLAGVYFRNRGILTQTGTELDRVTDSGTTPGEINTVRSTANYTLGRNLHRLYLDGGGVGTGNELNNYIEGNGAANILSGMAGDDEIVGLGGDDVLHGGAGDDILRGGTGRDEAYYRDDHGGVIVNLQEGWALDGHGGRDTLESIENATGSKFTDHIFGSFGSDWLDGRAGDDFIHGFDQADILVGREGNDSLDGGNGDDLVYGDEGNDVLAGGAGADQVVGGDGADRLHGGAGNDDMWGGNTFNLGADGDDLIYGDAGNDILRGQQGVDVLYGGSGSDILEGGAGDDFIYGGDRNDGSDSIGDGDVVRGYGARADYRLRTVYVEASADGSTPGHFRTFVTDLSGGVLRGVDMLSGIEAIEFTGSRQDNPHGLLVTSGGHSLGGGIVDDVVFQNATTGEVTFAVMEGGNRAGSGVAVAASGLRAVGVGDTDKNGYADVFLHDAATGMVSLARQTGSGPVSPTQIAHIEDYRVVGVGDVNADGFADFVIQNQANGRIAVGQMADGQLQGWTAVTDTPGWAVAGVGDFNGDGYADVLVQGPGGATAYADMRGGQFRGFVSVQSNLGADWVVKAVGDLTGEGIDDVIFQNRVTGDIVYADMRGGVRAYGVVAFGLGPAWSVKGVADVDNDGFKDVVVQHTGGTTYYADMNLGMFESWGVVAANPGADWLVI